MTKTLCVDIVNSSKMRSTGQTSASIRGIVLKHFLLGMSIRPFVLTPNAVAKALIWPNFRLRKSFTDWYVTMLMLAKNLSYNKRRVEAGGRGVR